MTDDTRTCITCKEVKPTTEFYTRKDLRVSAAVKLRLSTECKVCERIKRRAEQKKHYWVMRDPDWVTTPKPAKPVQIEKPHGGFRPEPRPVTLPDIPCLARIDAKWPDIAEAVRRQKIIRGVARTA